MIHLASDLLKRRSLACQYPTITEMAIEAGATKYHDLERGRDVTW